jgi:hypothetical protein
VTTVIEVMLTMTVLVLSGVMVMTVWALGKIADRLERLEEKATEEDLSHDH